MRTPDFSLFPTLETPRLFLRQPRGEDAGDIFLLRSDPEVMRYIPRPLAQSVDDVHALLGLLQERVQAGEGINWAMEWKETGEVVGLLGFVNFKAAHNRAEIGYSLAQTWHRRGLCTEAVKAVLDWGFSALSLHSVEAIVDVDNTASARLLEAIGFRQEALFLEDFLWQGEYRTSAHYGLLAREWTALNTNNA